MDEITIVSTWGRTTKAMERAVLRVRNRYQQWLTSMTNRTRNEWDEYQPRLYALEEINARYEKCGEVIKREMVARVASYYGADADAIWAAYIDAWGGPEEVSPDCELSPQFLNPKFRKSKR